MFGRTPFGGGRAPPQQPQQNPYGQQPPQRQQGPPGGYDQSGGQAAPSRYESPASGYPHGGSTALPSRPRGPPGPPQQTYPPQQPRGGGHTTGASGPAREFRLAKAPSEEFIVTNQVAVSPLDFDRPQYVICDDLYVMSVQPVPNFPQGTCGFSSAHRDWAQWSLSDTIRVAPYDPFKAGGAVYLGEMDIEVGFAGKKGTEEPYDQDDLMKAFVKNFENQIFAPGQRVIMDLRNIKLLLVVKTVQIVDLSMMEKPNGGGRDVPTSDSPLDRGILTRHTFINFFKSAASPLKLKGSNKRPAANSIIQPNFKFEDMGIGGLDTEFSAIFRRAFASRIFPPGLVEKLGIQHVKGILLFGPPGTGKTLIARQIGKMLNAREPKIVNGPEILNKYVGQSEENIRKLFGDAEKEYKEKGEESELHIIIFDELDAICKQRGSKNDGTGVGDSVVNQLLSKLDGVDQLNNVLIIGMTNRKDMIDEALLRPGRLEVHMEISLPDEYGRKQIIKIHTSKMSQNNVLDDDVDIDELAALSKNFSGAEINGLVKSATSFAFNRCIKVGTMAGIDSEGLQNMKVNRQDFLNAMTEIIPAFGVSEEELETCTPGGIIPYSPHIAAILKEGKLYVEQVRQSEKTPLVSVLLHGPPGAGKTALAASIAKLSAFPFVKLLSPESMVGYNESQKVSHISKVFSDAYKSPLSIVVIDNIERILDWVPIGPRFSNSVLQTILVLLRKTPPKGRRLLILCTSTERTVLQQMDVLNAFDAEIAVPNVTGFEQLAHVLKETGAFPSQEQQKAMNELQQNLAGASDLSVGIKKILLGIETARQDEDSAGRFAEVITRAVQFQ
ncbi:AAA-domain-containing protein [Ascobolus immersus RN42]|uniref:Vesicular-fusion protein SEC18 n=1 Tax=Ascobolus immersus RN42 TaxID=1160509 RepID=A0A3N4IBY2_ASCIM|nr:AAA-domain-containing protein [Ascobolus immersus RN42]